MSAIAFFPNTFNKEFSVVSPESVVQGILSGQWQDYIEYLRTLNDAEYNAEKKKLPAVTFSGVFKPGTRQIDTLVNYSGLVVIDVDKLEFSNITLLKKQLLDDDFVKYCFVSPSNSGLKIVFEVNTKAEHHRHAFLHIQHYLENKYLIKVDRSGKDVSRLCYVSWDPATIINMQSKVFEVDLKYGEIISDYKTTTEGLALSKILAVCIAWVNRNKTYQDGEKNVYLHALACALNRCGVKREDTLRLLTENFVTPDDKWHQSVWSAYFRNQREHATVQVRDIGSADFIAPEYVASYSLDVAENEIMRVVATLFSYKVPTNEIMDIVHKIGSYYDKEGYIDLRRTSLSKLMNSAILTLQQNTVISAQRNAMNYIVAEDMINEMLNYGTNENAISTGLPLYDDEMFGGLQLGNFVGIIGMGESFKSVMAQYICFINAVNGIPSLYLNSEMSRLQWYERFIYMAFGIDLRKSMETGHLNKETAADFIRQITEITKNNIFVVNDSGHTKASVLATMDHIYATTGKRVKIVVIDGLTQMAWNGQQEIMATINNSIICKDIAKEANNSEGVVVIGLLHVSGDIKRWYRDTGSYVRGGKKVLSNFDSYFCTSRLIDPSTNQLVNEDDVKYIPGKFYLRYTDKRSKTGIVNSIISVGGSLKLEVEGTDPNSYELRINKKMKTQSY